MQSLACRIRVTEPRGFPSLEEPAGGGACLGVVDSLRVCHRGGSAFTSVGLAARSLGQPAPEAEEAISLAGFLFSDLLRGNHSSLLCSLCLLSLWGHEISSPQMTPAGASPKWTSGRWKRGKRSQTLQKCRQLLPIPFPFKRHNWLLFVFFLVLELQGKMNNYVG